MLQGRMSGHVGGVADGLSDAQTHDRWQARAVKAKQERALDVDDSKSVMTMEWSEQGD